MAAMVGTDVPGDGGTVDPDLEAYRTYASELAEAIAAALPDWVARSVVARCEASGRAVDAAVRAAADEAGGRAGEEYLPRIRALLQQDPDDHRTTPLAMLRSATRHATEALEVLGVPPVDRDEFARHAFPEDRYDLTPATFADVSPSLHEPALVWGAAKAHVHLSRRRAGNS
jgi:hypothetical protein